MARTATSPRWAQVATRATAGVVALAMAMALLPPTDPAGAAKEQGTDAAMPQPDVFAAEAAATEPVGGPSTASPARGAVDPGEVVERRTRTSKTFVTDEGEYKSELYPGSVHYQGADGAWQDIDNTLVAADAAGYAARNRANRYTVQLPNQLGQAPLQVATDQGHLSVTLEGAEAPADLDGPTATYADALPGVDVEISAGNDVVGEELILEDADAQQEFTYQVDTRADLDAAVGDDGSVEFVDDAGQAVFAFTAPYMHDDAGGPAGYSTAIDVAAEPTAQGWQVTKTVDGEWLAAPERDFPVTVDPTIVFKGADQDCRIVGGAYADENYCGGPDLDVGWDGQRASRSLLQFNVQDALLEPIQVLNSRLHLYMYDETTNNPTDIAAHRVTEPWTNAATWNDRDTDTPWATAGGSFQAEPEFVREDVTGRSEWYSWHVTEATRDWLTDTDDNHGLLLKQVGEDTRNVHTFDSSDLFFSDTWPRLDITYNLLTGERGMWEYDGWGLTDRMDLAVNLGNGNLHVSATDLDIPGTGLDLAVERFFNARSNWALDIGNRWALAPSGFIQLSFIDDGSAVFYGPSDYAAPFDADGNGGFVTPTGLDATLTEQADGTYELAWHESGERFLFNPDGQLTEHQDQNGQTIEVRYDSDGLMRSLVDTQGRVTGFERNADGFVTTMTGPAGREWHYAYDDEDNLVRTTDPAGDATSYDYNDSKQLTRITDAEGRKTSFAYDSNHRITDIRDAEGDTWQFDYNGQNSHTGHTDVTDPKGHTTTHHWDGFGRIHKVVDALGRERSTAYTANSNVGEFTAASGAITTNTYDDDNNLLSSALPTGASSALTYGDSTHPFSPTARTDSQDNTTSFAYDEVGNMIRATDAEGFDMTVEYNPDGSVASITDPNGNVTAFGYDAAGNLTGIDYPGQRGDESFGYDSLSRLTSHTDGKGQTTQFSYDALDRLTQTSFGDSTEVVYGYDDAGNRVAMSDTRGTTSFAFDARNRLIDQTRPDGAVTSHAYDAVGNLTATTDEGGSTTEYGYNAVNKATSLVEPDGAKTTFSYDPNDNRTETAYPNGVTLTGAYDDADRLTRITGRDPAGAVLTDFSYDYTDPDSGADTALRHERTDHEGHTTRYAYDALNRLTDAETRNASGSLIEDYAYGYDPASNRTHKTVDGATTSYDYNAADQLTSDSTGVTYDYDANGNLTGASDGRSLGYNAADQTTAITPASGDQLGLAYHDATQVARAEAGDTSFSNTLQGVTRATDSTGTQRYTRDPQGNLVGLQAPDGADYYYLFDGLGSTVALTDAEGDAVNRYAYTPYGELTQADETVSNPWRFTGEYHDATTGLYKIGHRYYDPDLARWTQVDPSGSEPNAYLYAAGDPANNVDPSGLLFEPCTGVPNGIPGIFDFRSACRAHDYCYQTHADTQYGCDVNFLIRMASHCYGRHDRGWRRSACLHYARSYYAGVRALGWMAYPDYVGTRIS